METAAQLDTHVTAGQLFDALTDLDGYAEWLEIVDRVVPADARDGDAGPAWLVDLRARIGPLQRSKRLRMVRASRQEPSSAVPGLIRFERREVDGRSHSPWRLTARVGSGPDEGSSVEMTLFYGGSLWMPIVERLLREEIERSRGRLLEYLEKG